MDLLPVLVHLAHQNPSAVSTATLVLSDDPLHHVGALDVPHLVLPAGQVSANRRETGQGQSNAKIRLADSEGCISR